MFKKLKLLIILPFLAIIPNVKAVQMDYDFSGYNKATQVQFGLYNNTTLVQDALTTCTSSNDGFCAFENGDLSNTEVTFNNLRFVIRGTDGVTFTSGGQYKMSFFFLSNTSDYYITAGALTNTTGVSYQNFSNWTSNDLGIVSSNIIAIETQSTGADTTATLYRVDIVFSVSSSTVAGFNIRLYRNNKTIYSSTPCDIELFRYFSVSEVTPGSIDYSQDLNNINQSIGGLSDDISDSTQDIIDNQNQNAEDIQNTINDNLQSCRDSKNLANPQGHLAVASSSYITASSTLITSPYTTLASYRGVSFVAKVEANKTYVISTDISLTSKYQVGIYDSLDKVGSSSYIVEKISNVTSTFTPTHSGYAVIGKIADNSGTTITWSYIQVELGSSPSAYEPYGQQVCVNKLDEQNNAINGINDSLTDDNVSDANSEIGNFFSGFSETDHGGISGIVTAPLVVVNSMLTTNQCPDLQFSVMNTNVSFPSGCILWNNAPSNIVTIWQTIICGFVSYLLLRKLFKDIENLKNPQNSEVSTLDL